MQFLDHQKHPLPHFLGKQRQLNEVLVFVSVANDDRIGVHVRRQHCMQLRFGTTFESEVVFLAV